jgi:Fur family transcriptional regulator, ferric uptake regulator
MTIAPDVPALTFETLEEAIAVVRASGLRLSTARRLLLEALFDADGPVAAAHLVDALSIEESSVYRNLETLERLGLVRHVHLGHGPGLYALVGGEAVEYLHCERCAKVTSVSPQRLEPVRDTIRREFGYEAGFTHFAIVGICPDCAGASHPGETPDDHTHSHGGYIHAHPDPRVGHSHRV